MCARTKHMFRDKYCLTTTIEGGPKKLLGMTEWLLGAEGCNEYCEKERMKVEKGWKYWTRRGEWGVEKNCKMTVGKEVHAKREKYIEHSDVVVRTRG